MRRLLEELGVRVKRQLPGLSPEERAALSDAVGNLSYRERRVLELRYGLWGENPHTLAEVGEIFRMSPHRIQRIEQQALKKLPVRKRNLRRSPTPSPRALVPAPRGREIEDEWRREHRGTHPSVRPPRQTTEGDPGRV